MPPSRHVIVQVCHHPGMSLTRHATIQACHYPGMPSGHTAMKACHHPGMTSSKHDIIQACLHPGISPSRNFTIQEFHHPRMLPDGPPDAGGSYVKTTKLILFIIKRSFVCTLYVLNAVSMYTLVQMHMTCIKIYHMYVHRTYIHIW